MYPFPTYASVSIPLSYPFRSTHAISYRSCGPSQVRVQVAYAGICGTDITEYLGGPIFPPQEGYPNPNTGVSLPVMLGHEFSGTICEVGSEVKSLVPGQPVVISPAQHHRHYGTPPCRPCTEHRYNVCDATSTIGLNAPGGGFSDQTVVEAANCIALPSNVGLKVAALVEPLSIAHHCISTSGFQAGQSALICGAGPIGLAMIALLRVMGADKIIATEVLESRLATALEFGATAAINPLKPDAGSESAVAMILKLCPGGVHIAYDATGLQSTLDLCFAASKPGGVVFNVAIHKKPLLLNLNDVTLKEKRLMGGIGYLPEDFDGVIRMLADGRVNAEKMITSIVPLSNVVKGGFDELVNNRGAHIKILVRP